MNAKYDAVVIGAGHNGLTAACMLARSGRKVAVFESRETPGGLAAGHEFHPGFHTGGLLTDTSAVRPAVVEKLALSSFGLVIVQGRPAVFLPHSRRKGIHLSANLGDTAEEISRYDEREAEAYLGYRAFIARIGKFMNELFLGLPADVDDLERRDFIGLLKKGLALRRLGKKDMLEVMRINLMCAADWLDEWFHLDFFKAGLVAPALYGTFTGPRSPGSNANLVLYECAANNRIEGGAPALIAALTRAAQALAVEVRTASRVARIDIARGAARGITLAGGETIEAPLVLASCHPKQTLLELIDGSLLSLETEAAIRHFRSRGTTAVVNLALKRPISYACRPELRPVYTRLAGPSLDALEQAFDAAKYRAFSQRPVLEIHDPTADGSGKAPAGAAVASLLVHYAPFDLAGGWDEPQRQKLCDGVLAVLEEAAPGTTENVLASEVLAPPDLEARFGLSNGHIHHGEHALDQLLVRPTRDCGGYATPFAGLFLCGSGSPPGGGLTCLPGLLAARSALAR